MDSCSLFCLSVVIYKPSHTDGNTFDDVWFDQAVLSCKTGRNCEASLIGCFYAVRVQCLVTICEILINISGLVDFALNYAIAESWRDCLMSDVGECVLNRSLAAAWMRLTSFNRL